MDDLTNGLAKARRQPWLTRSTGVMAALVIGCGGFLAGIKVQQSFGVADTTEQRTFPQATARPQNAGGTGATTSTGTVKLVDGATIYIETADGRLITVKTGASTAVQSASALKDISVGTEVTVQGAAGGTDTVTATSITAHARK